METPIISVIIPCYNHGEFLEETIQSVEANTNKYPVEMIIVNDGSTDPNTIEILKNLEQKGYNIINQENQGLGKTRNNGIRLAKGKYILPLDSDNNVTHHYLNTAVDLLEKMEQIEVVYGNAKYFGERNGVWTNSEINIRKMLFQNHIDACALYRKQTWIDVNGYSDDMPYMGCEDWNFWLKCINQKKSFYFLNEICFEYRVLSDSMSRTTPDNFGAEIFSYNTKTLHQLYTSNMKKDLATFHNIFSGNIFVKLYKMIFNHFGRYNY